MTEKLVTKIVNGEKRKADPEEFKAKKYKKNIFNELDFIDSSLWTLELIGEEKVNDENLFSIFLGDKNISWIYIRDIKNSLTYRVWIYSFSESEEGKEIVLKDVTVYSYPATIELYEVKSIYLNFGHEHIIIEQAN